VFKANPTGPQLLAHATPLIALNIPSCQPGREKSPSIRLCLHALQPHNSCGHIGTTVFNPTIRVFGLVLRSLSDDFDYHLPIISPRTPSKHNEYFHRDGLPQNILHGNFQILNLWRKLIPLYERLYKAAR
jgi:hypothetical protein